MTPKITKAKQSAQQVVKDIRRATRRHFSAEDKNRIVLDGLRGEDSSAPHSGRSNNKLAHLKAAVL